MSLVALALAGCATPAGGIDTGTAAEGCLHQDEGFGALDRNGDGALTVDDVDQEQAAMRIRWTDALD